MLTPAVKEYDATEIFSEDKDHVQINNYNNSIL